MICTCAHNDSHTIARRSTADGKSVLLWNDGSITWAMGYAIKGSPFPRTEKQRATARRAGGLVLGEVSLYDAAELPTLIAAARWAADRDGLPGTLRARYAALTEPKGPRLVWTVIQADRDGRPTCRVSRLSRLGWPGLAVWHERGRYEVMREVPRGSGTLEATGFTARTLRELRALLPTLREF